jgi:hypothetical protein
MAIGDTVQAGLMRVDTTPLLQAQIRSSEQIGNAIAGLGRDIGSGIQKFMQNKKEGEAADMQIGALLQNMSPERQKEIQSGEGELGKSLSKFLSGELGISKKKALLGSLITINTADQLKREEAMAAERFKQQQEINNLNRQIAQGKIDDRLSDRQATDRFITKLYSQVPTGKLNEAGQDDLERGLAFLPPGPKAREESKNRLLQDPQFQQTEPVISMTGNPFLQQFANESPAVKERALAFMQAEQKRLADLAPDPTDLIKLREEARKTTEFDQGQDAISFSPDRNSILLGDTSYGISGKFGNEAEVIKLKSEAIPQYQNMNAVMNQLIELGEKRKNEVYMSNADKTLAASLSRQLQGLLREDILGPGTVTEPERQILEQIVQNPTTWMDTAGKTQDKINSLKGIRRNAFNKLKTRLTGLGLDVAEVGQSKSPAQNFDQQTSSGLGFTEIDLDQL